MLLQDAKNKYHEHKLKTEQVLLREVFLSLPALYRMQ